MVAGRARPQREAAGEVAEQRGSRVADQRRTLKPRRAGAARVNERELYPMWKNWLSLWVMLAGAFVTFVGSAGTLRARNSPDWTEPFPPFKIAGNLYYVGSRGLANYLITTPQGHILINSDLEANVPLIRASVEKLGFKFTDIKILLISHAHGDHNAASDTIKKLTGAKYMVMDADVPVVESGGKADFQYGNDPTTLYKPAKVDR